MLCIGYAKSVPDEGSISADANPSPVAPSLRSSAPPSPRGEESFLPPRPLQQQRVDAAGASAHAHHPRARLAAGAPFRDIDPRRQQPPPRRGDGGGPEAQTA